MHLAALVDTSMRNDKAPHHLKFSWLNTFIQTIGLSIKFIQWGKEWAHFFNIYTDMVESGLEETVRRPKGFSETKMANYVKLVYVRFREIIHALIVTLEEVKQESQTGDSVQREKAKTADVVMGKVYNTTFMLCLSFLIDVYTVYSGISTNFQIINLMPFDRMDRFNSFLSTYSVMLKTIDPNDCACSVLFDNCL